VYDENTDDAGNTSDVDDRFAARVIKRRASNQFRTLEVEWSSEVSQSEARKVAKQWEGLSWIPCGAKSGHSDYNCGSHVDCEVRLRVKYIGNKQNQQGAQLYSNGKTHAIAEFECPFAGRGPGGEFRAEIESQRHLGLGARGVYVALKYKYEEDPKTRDLKKASRIPSLAVITSFIAVNITAKSDLWTNVQLIDKASPMLFRTYEDLLTRRPNEIVVLETFCRQVDINECDEYGDESDITRRETTLGFVVASPKMLIWLRNFIMSLDNHKRPFTWYVTCDGTYRLCKGTTNSGAVLIDFGIHDITYNRGIDADTHNFLPLMFMYVQVECFDAYELLFRTIKDLPNKVLNLPGKQIIPVFGGLDRAAYIAKAYLAVWPEVEPQGD
jgi:hypothetical protein